MDGISIEGVVGKFTEEDLVDHHSEGPWQVGWQLCFGVALFLGE